MMLKTTFIAILSVAAVGLFGLRVVVPFVTGTAPVAIRTPSMQPTLPPGALVYIEPIEQPRVGDVVTFSTAVGPVTHRVSGDWSGIGQGPWQTKGDANNAPDADLVPTSAILGRAMAYVPLVGYAYPILSQPAVIAFVLLVALTILLWPSGSSESQRSD